MEIFNVDISPLIIVLLGCSFLAAILSMVFGMAPMRRVARYGRRAINREESLLEIPDEKLPGVTVVAYARNAQDNLREFVKEIESQNYPEFDIVIVNDGSSDMTREIAESLCKEYDNVKYTFVSDTAKNVSRVKVALALGIKASDKEVIVTTATNCRPLSSNWLRLLCAPLASPDTGISLGYSYIPLDHQKDPGKWGRSFDATVASSQWLGASLSNKPFRGDQYNLAFKKNLFFENKGFASSTALKGGHDDIFINEIGKRTNTVVSLHPDSGMEVDWESSEIRRLYRDACERHIFISRFLKTGAFRLQGFNSICIWLTLGFAAAAIAISAPNLFPVAVCAVIILALWGYEICLYRRTASLLHNIRLWWSVPFLWLSRPFVSAMRRQRANADSTKNYTWSVGMKR